MPPKPPKAEHINPFLHATVDAFAKMVRIKAIPGKPYLKVNAGAHFDVSGVIGLSGDVKGSIIISFPKATALRAVTCFIGEAVSKLDEVVADAVGELANIIAGAAKKDLGGYNIDISLPSVICGENHDICEPRDVSGIIIPFDSEAGKFSVTVNFKSE